VTEQGLHTTANDLDACIAKRPVNRTVATCSVDGADLAEWLVRNGLAPNWPQYSKGQVHATQQDAKRVGRGIWKVSIIGVWISTSTGLPLKKYRKLAADEVTMIYDYTKVKARFRSWPLFNPERSQFV